MIAVIFSRIRKLLYLLLILGKLRKTIDLASIFYQEKILR